MLIADGVLVCKIRILYRTIMRILLSLAKKRERERERERLVVDRLEDCFREYFVNVNFVGKERGTPCGVTQHYETARAYMCVLHQILKRSFFGQKAFVVGFPYCAGSSK